MRSLNYAYIEFGKKQAICRIIEMILSTAALLGLCLLLLGLQYAS